MTDKKLFEILDDLRRLSAETEVVEFKEAKNTYNFDTLGEYFSALSNEANLKGKPHAWLIFGVENENHCIVGSQYRGETRGHCPLLSLFGGRKD
jgi:ATP-dependent DNA helicase RecG